MEDNSIQGLMRLIDYRSSKLYKLEGAGHWFILYFHPGYIFETIAGTSDRYIAGVYENCYLLSYEGLDPDISVLFHGMVSGVKFKPEVRRKKMCHYFSVCRESVCKGCDLGKGFRGLKLTSVELKNFPLYMQNMSSLFVKLLKNC